MASCVPGGFDPRHFSSTTRAAFRGTKAVAKTAVPVSQGHGPKIPQRALSDWATDTGPEVQGSTAPRKSAGNEEILKPIRSPDWWILCERSSLQIHVQEKNTQRQTLYTPKFNIAPEKWWLEDYFPFGKAYFSGHLKFRGCTLYFQCQLSKYFILTLLSTSDLICEFVELKTHATNKLVLKPFVVNKNVKIPTLSQWEKHLQIRSYKFHCMSKFILSSWWFQPK